MLAPGRWSVCGAATGPMTARASPILPAVRTAVPDGSRPCRRGGPRRSRSSRSTGRERGEGGAEHAADREVRDEDPPRRRARARTADLRDAIARPARGADDDGDARARGELDDAGARRGWVTSRATSAPSISPRLVRESSAACSSRSSASSMRSKRQCPILPVARATATRFVTHPPSAASGRADVRAPPGGRRLMAMLRFRRADVTDPDALALLDAYFAERSAGFPAEQGQYRPTYPRRAVHPAGRRVPRRRGRRDGEPVGCGGVRRIQRARDVRGALRGQAPVALRRLRAWPGRRAACCSTSWSDAPIRVRRPGARARHECEPRGCRRALPVGPATSTIEPLQREPQRHELVRQARLSARQIVYGSGSPVRSSGGRCARSLCTTRLHGRPGFCVSTVRPQLAWLIDTQRQSGAPSTSRTNHAITKLWVMRRSWRSSRCDRRNSSTASAICALPASISLGDRAEEGVVDLRRLGGRPRRDAVEEQGRRLGLRGPASSPR